MNWLAFALVTWLLLGFEKGLRDALTLGNDISPSFVFTLVTFIAMLAPRPIVLRTAVILGVAMDLIFEIPLKNGAPGINILGPHALAYAVACHFIVSIRGLMIRRNPLTMGFLCFVGSVVGAA